MGLPWQLAMSDHMWISRSLDRKTLVSRWTVAAVNEEYVTHTIGRSIWGCNILLALLWLNTWGHMRLQGPLQLEATHTYYCQMQWEGWLLCVWAVGDKQKKRDIEHEINKLICTGNKMHQRVLAVSVRSSVTIHFFFVISKGDLRASLWQRETISTVYIK